MTLDDDLGSVGSVSDSSVQAGHGSELVRDPAPATVKKFSRVMLSADGKSTSQRISDEQCIGEGNRIISLSALSQFAGMMTCPDCTSSLSLAEDVGNRRGLVTKIYVHCTECEWEYLLSDPYTKEATGLNCKSVFGSRLMGKGRSGIETIISALLDLPPPVTVSSYVTHNKTICGVLKKYVHDEQLAAVSRLRALYNASPDTVLDVTVTYDGTWSKRGFTAPYCVGVVMSWVTGEVLDTELVSKYCYQCSLYDGPKSGPEYEQWFEGHKNRCTKTHDCSSPAMEGAAAKELFTRSVDLYKLRYSTVISDGDTKTVTMLNNEKVYGDVEIVKHECVGHVQKRVVNRLQKLKGSCAPQLKEAKRLLAAARKTLSDKKRLLRLVQADQRSVVRSQRGARSGRPRARGRGRERGRPSSRDTDSVDRNSEADQRSRPSQRGSRPGRPRGRGRGRGRGRASSPDTRPCRPRRRCRGRESPSSPDIFFSFEQDTEADSDTSVSEYEAPSSRGRRRGRGSGREPGVVVR